MAAGKGSPRTLDTQDFFKELCLFRCFEKATPNYYTQLLKCKNGSEVRKNIFSSIITPTTMCMFIYWLKMHSLPLGYKVDIYAYVRVIMLEYYVCMYVFLIHMQIHLLLSSSPLLELHCFLFRHIFTFKICQKNFIYLLFIFLRVTTNYFYP